MDTKKAEEKPVDKKDWAEMEDDEDPEADAEREQADAEKAAKKEKKKRIPQAKKGFKNDRGDYVVTSIVVPDLRAGGEAKEKKDEDSSSSETEYDDEDDSKDQKQPKEEAKGKLFFRECFLTNLFYLNSS
jgi:hypothetical protein